MRITWTALLACILVLGMTAGTATAKQGRGNDQKSGQEAVSSKTNGNEKKQENQSKNLDRGKGQAKNDKIKTGKNGENNKQSKAVEDSEAVPATVTEDTYGESTDPKRQNGPNGYKGLLKAVENTKDKPAGTVIANLLLTKYPDRLNSEQIAQLETLLDSREALTEAAELLATNGSVTDAVYMQEEALLADVSHLDSYKRLGALFKKAGRADGMRLFVNGEEHEAKPINHNGTTLVPLRAASEALDAQVSWNAKEKSVTVIRDGVNVKLQINSKKAYINNELYTLNQSAAVIDGTTVVPLRVIGEALGATVKWEPESQSVVVYEESAVH